MANYTHVKLFSDANFQCCADIHVIKDVENVYMISEGRFSAFYPWKYLTSLAKPLTLRFMKEVFESLKSIGVLCFLVHDCLPDVQTRTC